MTWHISNGNCIKDTFYSFQVFSFQNYSLTIPTFVKYMTHIYVKFVFFQRNGNVLTGGKTLEKKLFCKKFIMFNISFKYIGAKNLNFRN